MTAKDYRKIFGRKIKMLRDLRDVTQMELAKYLGYTSTGAVTQIEAGDKGVKFENIQKIADFFEVDAAFLVDNFEYSKNDLKAVINLRKILRHGKKAKHTETIQILLDLAVEEIDSKK